MKSNERVKRRQKELKQLQIIELKRKIEAGEASADVLKWKIRKSCDNTGSSN
jgi:hypothetical protein